MLLSLVAVCGATAVGADADSPRLTVAAYRSKANAICDVEQRRTRALVLEQQSLARYLSREIGVVRTALAGFASLLPPSRLAGLHASIVANTRREVDVLESLWARAKAGTLSFDAYAADSDLHAVVKREIALWERAGASGCAGP